MNKPSRYSGASIINHWVTAVLVIAMLVLGWTAGSAPSEVTEDYVMGIHIGLGFFVFLFVLWRTTYRLYEGFPETIGETKIERGMAYWVHRLLLVFLVLQVFTGPLYLFTENQGVNVFGWFTVYVPLEGLAVIHAPMELVHVALGVYLLPILLVLHLLGAFKHFLTADYTTPADL